MKRRTGLLIAMLAGILGAAQPAAAQGLTVGYADPEVIITYMPEYQRIQDQLAQEFRTNQEALQALAEDFQERVDRYQKQQPLLTAERRAEREQELADLQNEIQQTAAAKDQEMAQRQEQLMAPLLETVQGVIDRIAVERGIDLIVRSNALLFVNEELVININLDIARELGIEIDEEQTAEG